MNSSWKPNFEAMKIVSPKRNSRAQTGWEGFFPYYAGYPEAFAKAVLQSAGLRPEAIVCDPWNGSGTTTYTASTLGLTSLGYDINPAMIVVARARLLRRSEADSLEPLAKEILRVSQLQRHELSEAEPLLQWFTPSTAATIRSIERSIAIHLVGEMTLAPEGIKLDRISGLAATMYVALFTICRSLAKPFRSSNPTWVRVPKAEEKRSYLSPAQLSERVISSVRGMAKTLSAQADLLLPESASAEIRLADTTTNLSSDRRVDFVLTSPPYCTRIDYTAATRVELAILDPLVSTSIQDLSRLMMGSIRVPITTPQAVPRWGRRCASFLDALQNHASKASSGYYYKTHLDYFDKLDRSIENIAKLLNPTGRAIFVVQDSYYKDIHNDVPSIVSDISENHGLHLCRRENFHLLRSMSGVNKYTRLYERPTGAVEAVLCFAK